MEYINPNGLKYGLSNEDIEYWKVASKETWSGEIFHEGTFIEELPFNLDDTGRYVAGHRKGQGECPVTHDASGTENRVCVLTINNRIKSKNFRTMKKGITETLLGLFGFCMLSSHDGNSNTPEWQSQYAIDWTNWLHSYVWPYGTTMCGMEKPGILLTIWVWTEMEISLGEESR